MKCKDYLNKKADEEGKKAGPSEKAVFDVPQHYPCVRCKEQDAVLHPKALCDTCRAQIAATIPNPYGIWSSDPLTQSLEELTNGQTAFALDLLTGDVVESWEGQDIKDLYLAKPYADPKESVDLEVTGDVLEDADAFTFLTAAGAKKAHKEAMEGFFTSDKSAAIYGLYEKPSVVDSKDMSEQKVITMALGTPDVFQTTNEVMAILLPELKKMQRADPESGMQFINDLLQKKAALKDKSANRYLYGYFLKTLDLLKEAGINVDMEKLKTDFNYADQMLSWELVALENGVEGVSHCQGDLIVEKEEGGQTVHKHSKCNVQIAWVATMAHKATGQQMLVGVDCMSNISTTQALSNQALATELPKLYATIGRDSARTFINVANQMAKDEAQAAKYGTPKKYMAPIESSWWITPENFKDQFTDPAKRKAVMDFIDKNYGYGKKLEELNAYYAKAGKATPTWLRMAESFQKRNVPPPGYVMSSVMRTHGALRRRLSAVARVSKKMAGIEAMADRKTKKTILKAVSAPSNAAVAKAIGTLQPEKIRAGLIARLGGSAAKGSGEKAEQAAQNAINKAVERMVAGSNGALTQADAIGILNGGATPIGENVADPAQAMKVQQGIMKLGESKVKDQWAGLDTYVADTVNLGTMKAALDKVSPTDKPSLESFLNTMTEKTSNFSTLTSQERSTVYKWIDKLHLSYVAVGMLKCD